MTGTKTEIEPSENKCLLHRVSSVPSAREMIRLGFSVKHNSFFPANLTYHEVTGVKLLRNSN